MGVDNLWLLLQSKCDTRISLKSFVNHWLIQNQRSVRIAIDGYKFIFESDNRSIPEKDKEFIIIKNFMAKIYALISLNISFIIVFDGIYKPSKRARSKQSKSYETELNNFEAAVNYSVKDSIIKALKDRLTWENINYIQAPGEGEAQCAWLQQLGIVDYVITDDSDVFVFGATKVLKNFNRKLTDDTKSLVKKTGDSSQYYVTPVDISKGDGDFSLEKLIFLASLRGGDYSTGVGKIGIKYAILLALPSSNQHAVELKQELEQELEQELGDLNEDPEVQVPDFSKEFIDCFVDGTRHSLIQSWDMRRSEIERNQRLQQFSQRLSSYIRDHSKKVFKRKFTLNKDIKIDEYATMHYLFPFVTKEIYLFQPDCLNCCEFEGDCSGIQVPDNILFNKFEPKLEENIIRENNTKKFDQVICYKNGRITQVITVTKTQSSVSKFHVPTSFAGNIKHVLFKLTTDTTIPFKINKYKKDGDVEEYRLTCDAATLCKRLPHCKEAVKVPLTTTQFQIWVMKPLIEIFLKDKLNEFERDQWELEQLKKQEKKKSIKTQKTTLDSFPIISPNKTNFSKGVKGSPPSVEKPKKKRKINSKEVKTGQRRIDSFFGKNNKQQCILDVTPKDDNPFWESTSIQSPKIPNLPPPDTQYQYSSQLIRYYPNKVIPIIESDDENTSNDISIIEISQHVFELSQQKSHC